jgi:hypothetical protein
MAGIGGLLSLFFFFFPRFYLCVYFSSIFCVLSLRVAREFLRSLSHLDVGHVWDACAVLRGDGAGTFTLPDGSKYVGEYKDGKYHGQGMSCARGDKS